jgi:hypothetical protein
MGLPSTFSSLSLSLTRALAANCCVDTAFEPVTFKTFFPAHTAGALQQGNDLRRFAFLLGAAGIVTPDVTQARNRQSAILAKSLILLAGVAGLEPATPGFGDRCSTN